MRHRRRDVYKRQDKYHCRPNEKRSKLSIRNTTQNCGKYDGRYTHDKYKVNANYNYKYSNYDEYYHKRRAKECSNMYVKRIRTIKKCVRQEQQRGENERKRGRIK